MPKYALSIVALAILFFVLAAVLTGYSMAAYLDGLGLAFLAWFALVVVISKRASKYDLNALRNLHSEGGPPPDIDEIPDVAGDAGVLCPCCHEPYGAWLPACPHCGRVNSLPTRG